MSDRLVEKIQALAEAVARQEVARFGRQLMSELQELDARADGNVNAAALELAVGQAVMRFDQAAE